MRIKKMITISQENYDFLKQHPEIKLSALVENGINEYRTVIKNR
ncbi:MULTISPECIES: hypothetical protein [Ferroplasma]|nr:MULTISPECIES: hypothetical protein [Ferroplasma]WMT53510.1 MAG: hypothetical protein RE473_01350 [Ferroplasma acidiphilum]